jgi:hypothetical protein
MIALACLKIADGNSKGTFTYPPDPKVIHDRANDSSEEVTVQQ